MLQYLTKSNSRFREIVYDLPEGSGSYEELNTYEVVHSRFKSTTPSKNFYGNFRPYFLIKPHAFGLMFNVFSSNIVFLEVDIHRTDRTTSEHMESNVSFLQKLKEVVSICELYSSIYTDGPTSNVSGIHYICRLNDYHDLTNFYQLATRHTTICRGFYSSLLCKKVFCMRVSEKFNFKKEHPVTSEDILNSNKDTTILLNRILTRKKDGTWTTSMSDQSTAHSIIADGRSQSIIQAVPSFNLRI